MPEDAGLVHHSGAAAVTESVWASAEPRCQIAAASAPWVVDWPPAARGRLEQGLSAGGIVARVRGCEVDLLPHCRVDGRGYRYEAFTEKEEVLLIDSAESLFAQLPLGAARLLADVERSGGLEVRTTMVGRYALSAEERRAPSLHGRCDGATHVVAAATMGAFRMEAREATTLRSGLRAGAGRELGSHHALARDGDPGRCGASRHEAARPPRGCAAVLRVELDALDTTVASVENGRSCPSGASMVPGGNRKGEVFEPYCIDRFETTVEAYAGCVRAGACMPAGTRASWDGVSAEARELSGELCNTNVVGRGDHPINCVALAAAEEFCRWRGGTLPTDSAWTWAARLGSTRAYPWGDEAPSAERVNGCGRECERWFSDRGMRRTRTLYRRDDGHAGTAPVGSYHAGRNTLGLSDLSGNVAEWVRTTDSGGSTRVRGGSFLVQVPRWLQLSDVTMVSKTREDPGIGFRCVYPAREP